MSEFDARFVEGADTVGLTDQDAAALWDVLGPASASLPVVAAVESIIRAHVQRITATRPTPPDEAAS